MTELYLYRNIVFLRKKTGDSQAAYSQKLGITRGMLESYEGARVKPSIDFLVNLSRLTKISCDTLLNVDLEENPSALIDSNVNVQENLRQNEGRLWTMITTLQGTISDQQRTIDKQTGTIEKQTGIIERLSAKP